MWRSGRCSASAFPRPSARSKPSPGCSWAPGPAARRPDGSPRCAIVDVGHRRALDLALELPDDELGAVPSAEQMGEILDLIAAHVTQHRTTLVFVNTRRMAERVAHQLGERLGEDQVAAHHGSLSAARRQRVESRLRSGDLRALVATASLELGIDIGPVELVCQIGSPRSFATFLQRVGRSNHTRTGTPAGRLYPTSRDELVECAALLRGVRSGRLDALLVPAHPLDILAQQVVAECAAADWPADDLFDLFRRASPFSALPKEDFDKVVELMSEGIHTGRGRRAAYLHRDQGRRAAAGPARRPPRGAHLWRRHPGTRRLPRAGRAGRNPGRDGERGLGDREHGGRRVPARHDLLADPQGGARHGPGCRRPGRATVGAVLARRSARDARWNCPKRSPASGRRSPSGSPRLTGMAPVRWLAVRMRHRPGRGPHHRGLPRRRARRARGAPDDGHHRARTVLRRKRRDAACRARALRRPAEPGPWARPAQAVLRDLRLRTPGRGERRRHPAVARAAAQLPARTGAEVPRVEDGGERGQAGGPDLADVPGAVAVEPEQVAGGAADAGRPQEPARDPAHGGRRPHGRGVPVPRRMPGECRPRPAGDPRSSPRTSDARRLPARGDGHRRPERAGGEDRVRPGHRGRARHHRTVGARSRDLERPALHLP